MTLQIAEHVAFERASAFRQPKPSWILISPTSLGDTAIICALIGEFKKKHGGPVTMVVPQEHIPIAQMYGHDIDTIIASEKNGLYTLCQALPRDRFEIDQPIAVHPIWYGDGRWHEFYSLMEKRPRSGLSLPDIYRHMLRLDWGSEFADAIVPEEWRKAANDYADELGMVPGKSVILFPENNTCAEFTPAFWEILTDALNRNGYKVFTNMAGSARGKRTAPVNGSHPIDITLENAIPLVERAGWFVSGSNGMAFLLTLAKAACKKSILLYGKPFRVYPSISVDNYISFQSLRYAGIMDESVMEHVVNPYNGSAAAEDIAQRRNGFEW